LAIALGARRELLSPEQPTQLVECGGDVKILVRVDPAGNGGLCHHGHANPFCVCGIGTHGWAPDRTVKGFWTSSYQVTFASPVVPAGPATWSTDHHKDAFEVGRAMGQFHVSRDLLPPSSQSHDIADRRTYKD
jgi:hypothetical protein